MGVTDPYTLSQQTFSKRARAAMASGAPALVNVEAVDRFILRVGRPVPVVLVVGSEMGALCREFDRLGASAFGVDLSDDVVALARARYEIGNLRRADARELPFANSSFDGVWAGLVLCRMARVESHKALRDLHRVMRMGALLSADLLVGKGEEMVADPHGPVLAARWTPDEFSAACDALDMQLIDQSALDDGAVRLLFRREY